MPQMSSEPNSVRSPTMQLILSTLWIQSIRYAVRSLAAQVERGKLKSSFLHNKRRPRLVVSESCPSLDLTCQCMRWISTRSCPNLNVRSSTSRTPLHNRRLDYGPTLVSTHLDAENSFLLAKLCLSNVGYQSYKETSTTLFGSQVTPSHIFSHSSLIIHVIPVRANSP